MTSSTVSTTKEVLEELLRVELSACETYRAAIVDAGNAQHAPYLVDLAREHETAVGSIRSMLAALHDRGETPEPGRLGTVLRLVEKAAALFGEGATLRALGAGERALLGYLDTLLEHETLLPQARALLRDDLAPGVRRRCHVLTTLLSERATG